MRRLAPYLVVLLAILSLPLVGWCLLYRFAWDIADEVHDYLEEAVD